MLLTEVINRYRTPSDIDIYTAKMDYEEEILGGKLGVGGKYSKVVSDNTFLVFNELKRHARAERPLVEPLQIR